LIELSKFRPFKNYGSDTYPGNSKFGNPPKFKLNDNGPPGVSELGIIRVGVASVVVEFCCNVVAKITSSMMS